MEIEYIILFEKNVLNIYNKIRKHIYYQHSVLALNA